MIVTCHLCRGPFQSRNRCCIEEMQRLRAKERRRDQRIDELEREVERLTRQVGRLQESQVPPMATISLNGLYEGDYDE